MKYPKCQSTEISNNDRLTDAADKIKQRTIKFLQVAIARRTHHTLAKQGGVVHSFRSSGYDSQLIADR